MIMDLLAGIGREEFDYQSLITALSGYANPRDKITALLRDGTIIRVKKGIYVFGDALRKRPFSRELLANLIYGPSYLSLEYALAFHGLIPERVATLTSVTTGRSRIFDTPVGVFEYRHVPMGYFPLGMDRIEQNSVPFLIAVPEKALADKIRDDRGHPLLSQADVADYVFEYLRIEKSDFAQMDPALIDEMAAATRSRKLALCARLLRRIKERPLTTR